MCITCSEWSTAVLIDRTDACDWSTFALQGNDSPSEEDSFSTLCRRDSSHPGCSSRVRICFEATAHSALSIELDFSYE